MRTEKIGPWGQWRLVKGRFLVHGSRVRRGDDYDLNLTSSMTASEWIDHVERKATWWMPTCDKRDFARAVRDVLSRNLPGVTLENDLQ